MLNDGNRGGAYFIGVYLYPLIFPTCVSITILMRLFDNYIKKIIFFLIALTMLFILLNNFLFFTLNYMIAISGIAIYLILLSQKQSFKWIHLIDILFALNLFRNALQDFLAIQFKSWNNSVYIDYLFFFFTVPVIFLYYILINVKFWRSISR
jgi:hypothetical protein